MATRLPPNGPDEFKDALIGLRDFPVEDPDPKLMVKLFDWTMGLPTTADRLHWYCHRADETLVMAATYLIRLFAYDGSKKVQWLERLEIILRGCCDCVRGLQAAKWNARQTYLSVFPSHILDDFMRVANNWERDIVLESLANYGFVSDSPGTSPPSILQDLPRPVSYHIFFNLCILRSPPILALIQTHIPSSTIDGWPCDPPPPGLFYLLLHSDVQLRTFAAARLFLCQTLPMQEEAFKRTHGGVLEMISRAVSYRGSSGTACSASFETDSFLSTDENAIWEAVRISVQHIPDEFLRSSSSTPIDIAHTVAGRLHDNGKHFPNILRCFVYTVKRLKDTFWANRGKDYPLVVFASIKDNPSFTDLIRPTDTIEALPWFLLWVLDFTWSVWPLHVFDDFLAKMFDFLCEELQHERFKESRPVIMCAASKKAEDSKEPQTRSQRRAALNTLHIHVDRIVTVAFSREYTLSEWSLARRVSRELVYLAMLSDVKDVLRSIGELYEAFRANKSTKKGDLDVQLSPPNIHQSLWTKIYDSMLGADVDGMAMLIVLLSRIAHLDVLMKSAFKPVFDRIPSEVSARQVFDEVNRSLGIFRDGFSKVSSRFSNYNTASSIHQLLGRDHIVKSLWSLMFSPVEDVRMAGQTIVGQAFDVDLRYDCFQKLIRYSPEQSFKGVFSTLETFISYVPQAPEACMLSASLVTCLTDIIEVLAGPLDPLLFDQSFVDNRDGFKPAAEITTFWRLMARATAVIFQHTPAWSMFVDDNQWMVNWMRDALILTRQMLEYWRKFEEAILMASSAAHHSSGKVSRVGKRMVSDLQIVLPELARWLRLTDQELLHQSFVLLQSLFGCFEAARIQPDHTALTKLKQDVERALNRSSSTKLDSKRLKELRDLVVSFERADDEIEILPGPTLKQSRLNPHPADKKVTSGEKEPNKSTRAQTSRTSFWKPVPAPSREPEKPPPLSVKSQYFSSRDKEKLDAATVPRPKPIQPAKTDVDAQSNKSEPEEVSSSSSESEDDGGMASLRSLQKKKQPERRTKMMDIVPGATLGHARSTAQDEARRARERMKPDVSDLHRVILSWPYEHEGDTPPGKPLNPTPVLDRYPNYWQFRTTFEPLLLLECWAQLVNEKMEKKESYDLEITSRQYSDRWVDLDAFMEEHFQSGWFLTEADIVLLRNPRSNQTILAKVQSFRSVRGAKQGAQATLRCHLAGRPDPGLSPNTKWSVSKAFSLATVHREYAALVALEFYDYCDFILNPRLSQPPRIEESQVQNMMKKYRVNVPQARAIVSSLQSTGFSLIQGPPGTGKTSTICALVHSFLQSRAVAPTAINAGRPSTTSDKTPPKRVLICAPSNAAIDEVASRVRHRADGRPVKVVRVGAEKALNMSTRDISLDSIVDERLNNVNATAKSQNEELARLLETLKSVRKALQDKENEASVLTDNTVRARTLEEEREALQMRRHDLSRQVNNLRDKEKSENRTLDSNRRNIRMQVLGEADVVCSTLSGAGHEMLEHLDFEMIIIDEAAQAIELSTLIPLKFSCARCIMVGDPQQLPPTVISKEATSYNYNQSLFVRLQKHRPDAVHLLSIQYRMHPDISALPSLLFYQGRLLDGPDMAERTKRPWQENQRFGTYRFFNIIGGQEVSVGTSTTNPMEVQIATHLYARLTKEFSSIDFGSRVGVVTPYRQQVIALRQAFRKRFGDDIASGVDFNTVDGFQGQEKDIIILSCVRAGPGLETIGFLSDERRMNVALTRAKSSLFILGHAATLERSNKTWAQLIQDARTRSTFVDIDSSYFTSAGAPPKPHASTRLASPPPLHTSLLAKPLPGPIPTLLTPSQIRAKSSQDPQSSAQASLPTTRSAVDLQLVAAPAADKPGLQKKRSLPADNSATVSSSGSKPLRGPPPAKKPKQSAMFIPKKPKVRP
ncbi:SEN1 N terminal-domain-containing protein [Vararia minispora EC-137]|uniref:SEN1 N terminal-domain-containing protein n=1 Tax=Vararia minispora EC-137 TaxID=1314806 RepID=A0ACB8QHW2_9AGAM|nr:SEN1 N terminal-domain-containing protein [Vararia minispora EC-137]